jgi:hypothetical protein
LTLRRNLIDGIIKKLVQKISWLRAKAQIIDKKIWQIRKRNYICSPQPKGYLLINKDGAIAQLVEQRTENPCVAGSIPARTTEKRGFFEIIGEAFFLWYNI